MLFFSSLFRSRQQEQESRPPLPPRPSLIATQEPVGGSTDISFSSIEPNLAGGTQGELEPPVYGNFESLCNRFEEQLLDLQLLRSAHQDAVSTIEDLQSQLAQTIEDRQRSVEANLAHIRSLSTQLKEVTSQNNKLVEQNNRLVDQKNQAISKLRAELRQQQKAFTNRETEQRSSQNKLRQDERHASSMALARADQALEEQRVVCEQLAQRAEQSYQRLPSGILQSAFAAQPIQPFVVLLVDGDAYQFTRELVQDGVHGGARAAERIRTEIFKYMATHGEIPLGSKLIVRIFFNAGSRQGKLKKNGMRNTPSVHNFMISFSESYPLFDFLDCGSGKERADTKIRQNFELFVDNPYCRGMFLAVCYDAGFARMLEPYRHLQAALQKIVLIKAGQIANEFQSVPFKFTRFPSVFKELHYWGKTCPIGRTPCDVEEEEPACLHFGRMLCKFNGQEPANLPFEDMAHTQWNHPRRYVRSTATLLGLEYEATLLSAANRGALRPPEVIVLQNPSLQLCGPDDRPKTSPTVRKKRHKKRKV